MHDTQLALLIFTLSKLGSILRNGVNEVISCGIWLLTEARGTRVLFLAGKEGTVLTALEGPQAGSRTISHITILHG